MNNEALSELIQRFAISALSRERKSEALNEEILVGKYSGEFYIKTKDGIVLSADIMNRANASANEAGRIAELVGMTGELYRVDFEKIVLPGFMDYGTNMIQQEPIEIPNDTKEILLHLDLDEYEIVGDNPQLIHTNGDVRIAFEVIENGIKRIVYVDKKMSNVNFSNIQLNELVNNPSEIKLTNITINRDGNFDSNHILLLHNVYLTINK